MSAYSTAKAQPQPQAMPHKLTLDERSRFEVTGVKEVVRFDENAVVLKTVKGVLVLRGEQLHLQTLAPEGGRVAVDGTVNSLVYEELRERGGFFKSLFG